MFGYFLAILLFEVYFRLGMVVGVSRTLGIGVANFLANRISFTSHSLRAL